MNNSRNIGWIAAQGMAVLMSILLAFGIDAWWTEKQETQEVYGLLNVFNLELADNIVLVEEQQKFRNAKLQSAQTLLKLAAKPNLLVQRT